MKQLNQFITEYIINKKLDKPIYSEDHYDYFPETTDELIKVTRMLLDKGETNFNCIDTSKITNMSGLFVYNIFNDSDFTGKNGDISNWNVSNVEDMNFMFKNSKFNGDISNWDVSNVKDMRYMFYDSPFNGDISNWDVSNVNYMSYMFSKSKFNGDISNWDVSNVKDMRMMFDKSPLEKNPPKWYK